MNFFIQRIQIKHKKNLAVGREGDGGVARVSDFFLFSKESKSEGVKVKEYWLV